MSKVFNVLIGLAITGCLAYGYYYGADYAAEFAACVILAISLMALFCSPFIGYYLQKFDNNSIEDSDVVKVIKPVAGRGALLNTFNLLLTVIQVFFLVATGSTVIATIHLISSAAMITIRIACKKRYNEWLDSM